MRLVFVVLGYFGLLNALSSSEKVEEALDIRIPVVDMNDYFHPERREAFLDTLYDAMVHVGFFAVRHTGVDTGVVQCAYAEAEEFFRQDLSDKMECFASGELKGQRGFVPGETAKGTVRKDLKEFYHIGREGTLPQNIWPKQPAFKDALTTLYNELEKYVIPLQEAIVATINQHSGTQLPLDLLNATTKNGDTLLRALYYPALLKEETSSETPLYWAAPHTDIDLLAILPYSTEKGLQVEVDGQWLNVVVPLDAFIVNGGDMLENLTNGLFVSARHRVVAQEPGKDRFSMVLFVHPTDETALDPIPACIELTGGIQKYAPGTRQEFLWERLLELNIAPALLEPYSKTGHTERQMLYGRESPQVVELLIREGWLMPDHN
ncbi:MAG: 2-oxoglutarate and iron-dependent oxygenase domain-containing protein [Chlamydiota bacterium]